MVLGAGTPTSRGKSDVHRQAPRPRRRARCARRSRSSRPPRPPRRRSRRCPTSRRTRSSPRPRTRPSSAAPSARASTSTRPAPTTSAARSSSTSGTSTATATTRSTAAPPTRLSVRLPDRGHAHGRAPRHRQRRRARAPRRVNVVVHRAPGRAASPPTPGTALLGESVLIAAQLDRRRLDRQVRVRPRQRRHLRDRQRRLPEPDALLRLRRQPHGPPARHRQPRRDRRRAQAFVVHRTPTASLAVAPSPAVRRRARDVRRLGLDRRRPTRASTSSTSTATARYETTAAPRRPRRRRSPRRRR